LLRDVGRPDATVYRGDLWRPVAGKTFDLVTANLPHFPMRPAPFGCRTPSWGCGGADGRRFLDPFLRGLPAHLASAGRAVITHNAFVDLDRSRDILQAGGLTLRVAATLNVYIPQEKLELMTPAVLAEPDFAARVGGTFAFAPVPWGMAVAPRGSDQLATALDYASQIFHRDGVFLDIAQQNRVATGFLQQQHDIWSRTECDTAGGHADPACVLPPLDMALQRTRFAGAVEAFEHWLAAATGLSVSLPMFELAPAWSLFKAGLVNSLILVCGALIATFGFAIALAAALLSKTLAVRLSARTVVVTMQSSPIVLTLVMTAAVSHAFFAYSGAMALCAAMIALGLANGANAGQAIAEAVSGLRAERGRSEGTFSAGLRCASTQIFSFLVNAAKGAPVASFIGAPELLNALTDVTSFSGNGREITYALVLVFYLAVIAGVVWLCRRLEAALALSPVQP
jgi:polar amino acid transport system substrate-binding protein